ncbi:MAG: hypothetical protein OEM28_06690 [Nitrosopumilus sp.]|nr:hypothetical protein [Nitrosopumilus sp.]MDH3487183.1 hypothetical protein [Nitrosopumilus sp.]
MEVIINSQNTAYPCLLKEKSTLDDIYTYGTRIKKYLQERLF